MASLNTVVAGLGLLAGLSYRQLFTLNCAPLITERGDPILNPGPPLPGSHVHAVVGGTGFNLSMTVNEAPDSKNTTCSRQLDHSNYWQPQLYTQTANDSVQLIPFQGSVGGPSVPTANSADEQGHLLFQPSLRLRSRQDTMSGWIQGASTTSWVEDHCGQFHFQKGELQCIGLLLAGYQDDMSAE